MAMPAKEAAMVADAMEKKTLEVVPALYVGDLHPDVTDATLFELFSTIGTVTSVRVCRDNATGSSLGYGYVNYVSVKDANTAIERLNHNALCGKPFRIMLSHRDPDVRNSGIGNVFVKNLNGSIDSMKLQTLFMKFGTIFSCKVVFHDGKSKGFGFVQFDSQDSANAAIKNLNGTTIDGKQIYVGNFIKKSERIVCNPEDKYTNLYMKNLNQEITEELIEQKFSEYGKIHNVMIAKDEIGNSKGFGFVNFENSESAKKALEAMNGLQLGSKTLYVARAQKREERKQVLRCMFEDKRNEQIRKNMASNLYVKNIDDSVDDNALHEHFSKCGTITSAKVMYNEKGTSKGFGFVCYITPEEAAKAVNTLHGCMFHGKPLYVAISQRKEVRHAQMKLQRAQRMVGLASQTTAVIPTGYPPLYYSPPVCMPQICPRQGVVYQPYGLRAGWLPNGYVISSSRQNLQPMSLPVVPNTAMPQRQNKGRLNGHLLAQSGQSMSYAPQLKQFNHSPNSLKDANGQQKHALNGRQGMCASPNSSEVGLTNSMLSTVPPQEQPKQMLGKRLFPLIQKLRADMAGKITGMLLEMDASEVLVLLESPESLAKKVEEAAQVLKLSKNNVTGQEEPLRPNNFIPAGVSVN